VFISGTIRVSRFDGAGGYRSGRTPRSSGAPSPHATPWLRTTGPRRPHDDTLIASSNTAVSTDPIQRTLGREETDALAIALTRLDADDRELLLADEVTGTPPITLASERGTSVRAISMRLARARAALRVEFVPFGCGLIIELGARLWGHDVGMARA
jgi:hypothetical protein